MIPRKNILSFFCSSHFYSKFFRYYSTYPSSFFKINSKFDSDQIYDFRSDTVTKPTDEMFDIMRNASRNDDVLDEDESTNELETYMAELTGHEAALFVPSGTMTNQIAIRAHLSTPPHSVLCDFRSHICNYEAGGIAYHSQASVTPLKPSNKLFLTCSEIESELIVTDDIHYAPTRVISLENTLNGLLFPIDEIHKISKLAKKSNIKLHLDGARLWNACAETNSSLQTFTKNFDSVSLCLSKSIGAPIGSVLVGNKEFIKTAKHLRKLFGGGWRQCGLLAAAAKFAIASNFPDNLKKSHLLTKKLSNELFNLGIHITLPVHTNMIFIDTKSINITTGELANRLALHNILIFGNNSTTTRLVLHYQIPPISIEKFIDVVANIIKEKKN
ncbi:pyridoxal phosphate-dependent transferase [Glomus cerebriforme]|uniref:Pyridoxal phosphate-dependent transferase n=1 Tax=Glomus cerebriforme TaxID=658196 RepID=A0A397SGE8_9GLOM|nr:pyridoxal phosphate-dependent transferase [Glomus cerebriforme]